MESFPAATMNRISAKLSDLRGRGRTGLVAYVTVGFPERDSTCDTVEALIAGGVDMVELGVPFSDPLAEGSTIQRSGFRALQNGVSLAFCIDTVRLLRERGVDVPLLLMGYYNPILSMGNEEFIRRAAEAGVDGVVVPDLPPEEASDLLAASRKRGLETIFLLAPTSSDERIDAVAKVASGFIYCTAVVGVTGAREAFEEDLAAFVSRVRARTDMPIGIGFGISKPEHVEEVGKIAELAIVGSAIIDRIESLSASGLGDYVRELKGAVAAPAG